MDDDFDFDFDKPSKNNKPKNNDPFGDDDFDFDFDKPKASAGPTTKKDDPFGDDDFDFANKQPAVKQSSQFSAQRKVSDDPFADEFDFDAKPKVSNSQGSKKPINSNQVSNSQNKPKTNNLDDDDDDPFGEAILDSNTIAINSKPTNPIPATKESPIKASNKTDHFDDEDEDLFSDHQPKTSINSNDIKPTSTHHQQQHKPNLNSKNHITTKEEESDQEEEMEFDSEPEEEKHNTIYNNNNKNQALSNNEASKQTLQTEEDQNENEDHFEKTLEESMSNLNDIKDKTKTGQYDKIVNDQISEYSEEFSKGSRNVRSNASIGGNEKTEQSIRSNQQSVTSIRQSKIDLHKNYDENDNYKGNSIEFDNKKKNDMYKSNDQNNNNRSQNKHILQDETSNQNNIDNYKSQDESSGVVRTRSLANKEFMTPSAVGKVVPDNQKRHNNVYQLKEKEIEYQDPRTKQVESNFHESIEEISPVHKTLEKNSSGMKRDDSIGPKDFDLRNKHQEKIMKLSEEKVKQKSTKSPDKSLKYNDSSENIKFQSDPNMERIRTRESDKSLDTMNLIKQKHKDKAKEQEAKVREDNYRKALAAQEKKISNIGKVESAKNQKSKQDVIKSQDEKLREKQLDRENFEDDKQIKEQEKISKQNALLKKEILDLKNKKDVLDHMILKQDKQIEKQNQNAQNRSKVNSKDTEKLRKQISILEDEHVKYKKKIDLLSNPEARHNLAEELRTLDDRIVRLAMTEKELKENIAKNEIMFQRLEKVRKKDDKEIVQNEFTTLSKDYTDKLESKVKIEKQVQKSLEIIKEQEAKIEELRSVTNVIQVRVDGEEKSDISRYKLYTKLKKEYDVLNHKNVSDSKKFERDFTGIVSAKSQLLMGVKEIEQSVKFLDDDIEDMLASLFKLVKECVQRNIPPSSLVRECNLNIDEAALHKSAFELTNRVADIDQSLITNDRINADGEIVDIPQIKDSKNKIKAITHIVEDSKLQVEAEMQRRSANNSAKKKQVVIESANKVPTLSSNNSKITIEKGFNDGKSFQTMIETDRDGAEEVIEDRMESPLKAQAQHQVQQPAVNNNGQEPKPKVESAEPAFKLDTSDLKALNINTNAAQQHQSKNSYVQPNPVVSKPKSRGGNRVDVQAQQDPFGNDESPFITNQPESPQKADPFGEAQISLYQHRQPSRSNLALQQKPKGADPFGDLDLDQNDPFASARKETNDPFASNVKDLSLDLNKPNLNVPAKKSDPFGDDPFASRNISRNGPVTDPFASRTESRNDTQVADPFATGAKLKPNDPFTDRSNVNDPFATGNPKVAQKNADPFGNDPFSETISDPFGKGADPFLSSNRDGGQKKKADPFGDEPLPKKKDPFGATDPFGANDDPFGGDPFI